MPAKTASSSAQSRSEAAATQQAKNKPAKSQLWLYKVLPALLLAACCWLALAITDKGLASAYYFKANYYLELWQRKPETLDLNSWQQAADAIETAVKLHPHHPHYLITLAKINEWAWYKGLKTADQIAVNDELYKLAIELRPNWPNAYADYAYYLGIVNFRVSEAFTQLDKGRIYGPYSPEVLLRVLLISAKHWQILNGDQKKQSFIALEEMIKNSYPTYKQAMTIGQDFKLLRTFCIYLRLKKEQFTTKTNTYINRDYCS
ncbi:hypothetical protein [Rheinheimera sp.]|uniref:hypothetical protein n=1 Tax=Rheinheimera sp. TaxID=1869214 RepID=UPI002634387D|nr:hypothetical protein [Rheinheimera sp.]MCA1931505.1 hypothetical protein [Rheinheimera sp.]